MRIQFFDSTDCERLWHSEVFARLPEKIKVPVLPCCDEKNTIEKNCSAAKAFSIGRENWREGATGENLDISISSALATAFSLSFIAGRKFAA